MSVKRFFDTNVLVYACDSTDSLKQATALKHIADAADDGSGVETLSEDLNDGQDYDGVVVVNPFRQQ